MLTTIWKWRIVYEDSEVMEFGVPKEKLRRERRDSPKNIVLAQEKYADYYCSIEKLGGRGGGGGGGRKKPGPKSGKDQTARPLAGAAAP